MFFFWIMVQIWAVYYRHKVRDYRKTCFTPKSYTVWIKGLPKFLNESDYNIKKIIRQSVEEDGFSVTQVSCVYDTVEYTKLRMKLRKDKVKLAKELYKFKEDLYEKLEDKEKGTKKIKETADKIESDEFELDKMEVDFDGKLTPKFTGHAFISFNTKSEKKTFERKHKMTGCCYKTCGCFGKINEPFKLKDFPFKYEAYVMKAPEPNDIYWESLSYKTNTRRCYAVLAWTLGIIVSVIAFCVVLFLYELASNYQTELTRNTDNGSGYKGDSSFAKLFKKYGPAFSIVIVNELAAFFIEI